MEFNQVLDWRAGPGVCRCCLSEGCYKDISTEYFWMGEKEIYAEMLLECYSLTISYQEGRPNSNSRLICEVCITRLRDAANFKKQVINSERNFAKHLIEVPVEREVEVTYTPTESLPIQQVKDESRVSDDGDFDDSQFDANFDCDDDADDQPLKNFATNVLKREDTVPDVTVEKVKTKDGKSPSKRKAAAKKGGVSPAKKAKAMKQEKEAKPSSSKPPKTERKKGTSTLATRALSTVSLWGATALEKQNAATLIEHSTICPFLYPQSMFKCFFCHQKFADIQLFLEHFRKHDKPERPKILKLLPKTPCKVDISNLNCSKCSQSLADVKDLREHLIRKHDIKFNIECGNGVIAYKLIKKNGLFACHLCSKSFHSFFVLNKHMNGHFDNVVCETCGLGFISHPRLWAHKQIHETGKYPCEKCKKVFNSPVKRKNHISRTHDRSQRMKCPHCSEKFVEYNKKLIHLRDVHDIHYSFECELCRSIFPSRRALTRHTTKEHLHKIHCECCNRAFSERSELKLHMVVHTRERNFQCTLCDKAYAREKNLKEHMRIHTTDWKFICSECNHTFLLKNDLKKHKKELHQLPTE